MGGRGWGAYAASQTGVACEETQSNRVSDFRNFVCSLFPMAILFYFYFTVGGRKKLPLHHHSAG